MSFKEDIDGVKKEIDNEEKLLTAFVRVEKFVKKYKTAFVAAFVSLVIAGAGYLGYAEYEEARISAANEAYLKLVKNPNDKEAYSVLKQKSTPLYEAYTLQVAVQKGDKAMLETAAKSQNKIISDIAAYEIALLSKNPQKLAAYASNKDAFYRDLAFFVTANKLIEKGDYKGAKDALNKIPADSAIKEFSNFLYHSIVTF